MRNRKHLTFLLLTLFSISSIGFSGSVHYCNGHLSGFSLLKNSISCHTDAIESCHSSVKTKSCCSKSANLDPKDCCQNTDSYNVMEYDGITIDYQDNADLSFYAVPYIIAVKTFLKPHNISYDPCYPQPPPLSGHDVRIKLGSFLC